MPSSPERTDWNGLWREAGHRFNTWPNEDLVRWASTLERGSRVLEVGCGNGANLRALRSFDLDAVGVDVAEEALLAAAGFSEALEIKLTSACELTFPDSSFDAVCDVQCLQHLSAQELTRAYDEIRRVLKPGGAFFAVVLVAGTRHFPELHFNHCAGTRLFLTDAGLTITEQGLTVRDWHGRFYAYSVVECVKPC